jgi:two-component system sensor histidine kinase HydH
MDIDVVIRKSFVYSVLAALITGIYFSLVMIAEKMLQGVMGYRSLVGSVVAGFAIALGFTPLKEFVQQFVDRLFFRGSHVALAEENQRLRQEITRSERMRAVSTLAAGLAHEIKNPLAAIKTVAEFLPERYDDPVFREKFSRIMAHEVSKINGFVTRLLEFAKPSPPRLERVRVSEIIQETLAFLHGTLLSQHVRVETAFERSDEVQADAGQLKQVLLNILMNSLEAMPQDGRVAIRTANENGYLDIVIADTGPGIEPKHLPHIFDPFYTTKPTGTGLGLSVVHSIIQEHGGRVTIASQPGLGTRVTLRLRRSEAPQTHESNGSP